METLRLNDSQIEKAISLLKNNELVAIPTETVYGLAANALSASAVKKIFKVKNRPGDNPIIIHISEKKDILKYAYDIHKKVFDLIDSLWPGPLTVILKKKDIIPYETSGNLDTVAIRMPSMVITKKIIEGLGSPIAAPSANISGRPSSVTAEQVLDDLDGLISAVVISNDISSCNVGVESTVLDMSFIKKNIPILLRPGIITANEIEKIIGRIEIYSTFESKDEKVISPGLKYKHYAPNTNITIVKSNQEKYLNFVNNLSDDNAALCFDEDLKYIKIKSISYGKYDDPKEQCNRLFTSFREIDKLGLKNAWARISKNFDKGIFLAVYNRLLRACSFRIKKL